MGTPVDYKLELARFDRSLAANKFVQIKNVERLRNVPHPHTAAMCRVMSSLLDGFPDKNLLAIVEAEILKLGAHARPEDIVIWIDGVGVLVIEVKSHRIEGIRSFENNVPQVNYHGESAGDVDLLDQPKHFAYKLKGPLEELFDDEDIPVAPLYYVGWLPFVSLFDVQERGQEVVPERVWFSDSLDVQTMQSRLESMKNITGGVSCGPEGRELFAQLFGVSSGLGGRPAPRATQAASIGHLIDQKNQALKQLTGEQETLAFSPNLVIGPKVIRGVVGSGKTVVLANALSETLIREYANQVDVDLFKADENAPKKRYLVLCYNRTLVPFLERQAEECFIQRRPYEHWVYPKDRVEITNIDRFASRLAKGVGAKYDLKDVGATVDGLLETDQSLPKYDHIFIDEGQDIQLEWYSLIQQITRVGEFGPSIVVFYDEAQNIYGVKRPGAGGQPPWKTYLGATPNPRGLPTIMRIGHRNTNQILSFSFDLLLGGFSAYDPQMVQFSEITSYLEETIPTDPKIDHPNAGNPCVEKLGERHFRVNFAVHNGPNPNVYMKGSEAEIFKALTSEIHRLLKEDGPNVRPDDILILATRVGAAERCIQELEDAGVAVHSPHKKLGRFGDAGKDQPLFQDGKVTVSSVNSAKGYTSHIVHLIDVHNLDAQEDTKRERMQKHRAMLHVACTRASLFLSLWGTRCDLMMEAKESAEAIRSKN